MGTRPGGSRSCCWPAPWSAATGSRALQPILRPSDLNVDRPDDLGQLLVGGVLAWLRWRRAPGKVGAVDLHQPPASVGLADGEQRANVVLGHNLHERVLDNLEAVENVRRDNRDVAGTAGPALVTHPHDELAADDPEHLVTEMGVHRPPAGAGGRGARG